MTIIKSGSALRTVGWDMDSCKILDQEGWECEGKQERKRKKKKQDEPAKQNPKSHGEN